MGKSKSAQIRTYFEQNQDILHGGGYGKVARTLGLKYDLVYAVATKLKQDELQNIPNNPSIPDVDFETIEELRSNDSLKSYCESYGIDIDTVTSAKFVNHNGQEAWNVLCDTTILAGKKLDNYFEKLKETLSKTIKPVDLKSSGTNNEAAYHNYIADAHVGAAAKSTDVYENEYNGEVFMQRMLDTVANFREEAQLRGRFEKFLHVDLGDSVNSYIGKTSRGLTGASNHTLNENMDASEIYDTYVRVLCEYFDTLISYDLADEYEFIAISNDNHGSHFSYVVNRSVEMYLNIKYPNIKTKVERQFISEYKYGIHDFLFTHGKDEVEMKFGFPIILNEKTLNWLYQYLRKRNITGDNVHVVKGDLHQEASQISGCIRYRNILSLYGSNSWSMLNYGHTPSGYGYEIVYKNRKKVLPGAITFN